MRAVAVGPALLRAALLVAGVVLLVVPSPPNVVATALAAAGLLGALVWPDRVGAGPLTAAFVLDWLSATGWHGDPSLPRTVLAAAALYVLHSATALAAVVPLPARVAPPVLRRWAVRSALVLAAATAVIAADYAIDPRRGSPLLELAGLLAALLLVAVPVQRALR